MLWLRGLRLGLRFIPPLLCLLGLLAFGYAQTTPTPNPPAPKPPTGQQGGVTQPAPTVPNPATNPPGGQTGAGSLPPQQPATVPPPGSGNQGSQNTAGSVVPPNNIPSNLSGTVTMDFRNADINNVLKFFAMATNWQIIPDPSLSGTVTIICPHPLSIDQAFQVLQSTLQVRGFIGQFDNTGNNVILKIVPLARAVQSTTLLQTSTTNLSDLSDQVVTLVIPIQNADAATLAKELQPVINVGASLTASSGTNSLIVTDIASNVERISQLVNLLDKTASSNEIKVFTLKNSDATEVSSILNQVFQQMYNSGNPVQAAQPQPGRPGFQQENRLHGTFTSIADTNTNSVIVLATKDNMEKVTALISQLDSNANGPMSTKIVKLKYADATDAASIINEAVTSNATSTNATRGGFFGLIASRLTQGEGDQFSNVVADPRTNSLIITANPDRMKKIDAIIQELDVDVPAQATTAVIPLQNVQASNIASMLNTAFGANVNLNNLTTSNMFNSSTFGTNVNRNTSSFGLMNNNTFRRSIGVGRGVTSANGSTISSNDPTTNDQGIPGVLTNHGFVPDTTADPNAPNNNLSRQGPFIGNMRNAFNQNGANNTTAGIQWGRGQTGEYTGLINLSNNVSIIPDTTTNSLIVNGTPDAIAAVKDIVAKLDVAPKQVMIEVIIAEASLDAAEKLGFQFDAHGIGKFLGTEVNHGGSSNFSVSGGTYSSNTGSPMTPGFQYGLSALNGNFDALLQALKTDQKVHIISTPKIFTANNQTAEIQITTDVPYVTSSYSGGILNTGGSNVNYSFLPVGVQLEVDPHIASNGLVTIDVASTTSELLGYVNLSSGLNSSGAPATIQAPETAERTAYTSVAVRNNELVALGGMMSTTETKTVNKVPLLGDLPLIGSLFQSTSTDKQKTELMIFMVPHIVETDMDVDMMTKDSSKGVVKEFPNLPKQFPSLTPITTEKK
jgi:general secretion pathway protein D